jgi:hypothetical protein
MKKIVILSAILLALGTTAARCQQVSDPTAGDIANLKTLLTDHIEEKAYLHFDRPYLCYVAGETMYFKAYVTIGEMHQPTALSGILHVDLIEPNNVLLKSIAVQLINGAGHGDFGLPDTLQKGSYRVRAYTEWMRNDKTPYFFDQFISVGSVNSVDKGAGRAARALKPDLQFFPEGGNLLVDVPSRVAFKALGADGMGINVTGVVVDNEDKEVAAINTYHLGMGIFRFIPEDGKTYTAKVTFGNGVQTSIPLPQAQSKGFVLSVNTTDPAKVSIGIRTNREYFKANQNQQLGLLVYYGGSVKRYSPKLESSNLGLDLPANTFPTGIVMVTLLSATGEPLNERLVFIQNNDLLNLSISAYKDAFKPRENVALNLSAKNKDGSPVSGSFSVSVIDESKILVDEYAESTLASYMLLTSAVKGYIEKPNYYFADVSGQTRTDLDILMLTQGYRRFSWSDLAHSQAAQANAFQPEKGINVSGMLKTKNGQPLTNCDLTLVPVAGGAPQIQKTDDQGRFTFADVPFWGGSKFILKALSATGRKSILTLDKPAENPPVAIMQTKDVKYNANADILASLQNDQGQGAFTASAVSEKVLTRDQNTLPASNVLKYRSSNLGGPGHADQVILGDAIKNSASLSIGLNGLLRGVVFYQGQAYLSTGMELNNGGQSITSMLLIVDGVNAGNGADIDVIQPNSVEAVEVLKGNNAAIYGVEGGAGVLVITTKTDLRGEKLTSTEMSPGLFSIEPAGFYKAREFYIPKYDAANPAANLPDHRTTIYWQPDVITDTNGSASFNFFNSDSKGTYRVEVQGMDSNGNMGRQVFRYKVQ